jgi:antitoxin ParD1/3/4
MTQIQISLPETANQFIQEQIASGRYGSPSDLVVDLVEKARTQAAKEKLAQLIREGIESGEGVEITDDYWNRFEEKLKAELERRRSA